MNKKFKILDNKKTKIFASENYNLFFDKETGFSARWGKTKEDDPDMAPVPEILDIEISEICHGIGNPEDDIGSCSCKDDSDNKDSCDKDSCCGDKDKSIDPYKGCTPCKWCYKGNVGSKGRNMSFETFKTIIDKMAIEVEYINIEIENGYNLSFNPLSIIDLKDGTKKAAKDLLVDDKINNKYLLS